MALNMNASISQTFETELLFLVAENPNIAFFILFLITFYLYSNLFILSVANFK